jgi:hypothetical protein
MKKRVPTAVALGFLDRSRYFLIPVAPHLSSGDQVDPVPEAQLLRKTCGVGNRTQDLWASSQEL